MPSLVQEFHHRDGAGGRQLPVGRKDRVADRRVVGVAVDLQHPVDVLGDARGDLDQPLGDAGELLLAAGLELRRARREQHLRLEDEAVADDLHVALAGQRLAQLAEELGAVARQLLDLAGERAVELLAEIDDLGLLLLGLGVGGVERDVEAGELVLERRPARR